MQSLPYGDSLRLPIAFRLENRVSKKLEVMFYCDLDSRNDIDVFNAICESVEDFESAIDLYTSNQYIYYGRVNFSNLANDLATNRIKCLECSDDVKDFILANFNYRGYADTLSHYITKTEFGYVEILY